VSCHDRGTKEGGTLPHTSNCTLIIIITCSAGITALLLSIAHSQRLGEDRRRPPFLRGPVTRVHQVIIHGTKRARLSASTDTWCKDKILLLGVHFADISRNAGVGRGDVGCGLGTGNGKMLLGFVDWTVDRPWICCLYRKTEWLMASMATEWMAIWLVLIADRCGKQTDRLESPNGGAACHQKCFWVVRYTHCSTLYMVKR